MCNPYYLQVRINYALALMSQQQLEQGRLVLRQGLNRFYEEEYGITLRYLQLLITVSDDNAAKDNYKAIFKKVKNSMLKSGRMRGSFVLSL